MDLTLNALTIAVIICIANIRHNACEATFS